jgi:hypothetical protein
MTEAAVSRKKNVMKRVGNDKVCEVGEVIMQVDNSCSQARIAVKKRSVEELVCLSPTWTYQWAWQQCRVEWTH